MSEIRAIEISQRRILEVDKVHFDMNFKRVNANGDTIPEGEQAYLIIRHKDNKVFKPAKFIPADATMKYCVYLEEL